MAKECAQCGSDLFIDETRCPNCQTPLPPTDGVAGQGAVGDGARRGPPPPEGIGLIVDKMRADQDSFRDSDPDIDVLARRGGSLTPNLGFEDLADAVRPERDREGNIQWDLKYALVGALVVAIACGLIFFYLSMRWSSVSHLSRIS